MKILLANDDGFNSKGIQTLDKVLTQKGHEVWVCAPDSQRSGSSHATHLNHTRITKVADRHYICNGFPVDCVLYPLLGAIPIGTPDVVISGINEGFNICTDRHYSGTIGAAEEGAMKGVPSIALSCEKVFKNGDTLPDKRVFEDFPFEEAADFIAEHIEEFCKNYRKGTIYNINVPDGAEGKWVSTKTGITDYEDKLGPSEEKDVFSICGATMPKLLSSGVEETDYYTVFAKKLVSVAVMEIET